MRRNEYKSRYPTFSGYLHDFSDPSDDDVSDEDIARRLRADWPVSERIRIMEKLIPETQRMLDNLDNEWEAFSDAINHHFTGAGDARAWLISIREAWIEELASLKSLKDDRHSAPETE